MPRYLVERTFEPRWDVSADFNADCRRIVERNGEDVTWLHSYVSEDGRIRLENEDWSRPTLQERRAVIYAARDEIARLTELVETLESLGTSTRDTES